MFDNKKNSFIENKYIMPIDDHLLIIAHDTIAYINPKGNDHKLYI